MPQRNRLAGIADVIRWPTLLLNYQRPLERVLRNNSKTSRRSSRHLLKDVGRFGALEARDFAVFRTGLFHLKFPSISFVIFVISRFSSLCSSTGGRLGRRLDRHDTRWPSTAAQARRAWTTLQGRGRRPCAFERGAEDARAARVFVDVEEA